MSLVGELLVVITGNNGPLSLALAKSEAELKGFSATANTQGAAAAGGIGLVGAAGIAMGATVAVGAALAVKAASDFQEQMAIINTIAHQTPTELAATGDAIRGLAASTGEPLSDLTKAFYDLLSAGVPVNQAMSVLKDSTTLAIGGLATTAQTVDLLTTAMNSYQLTAEGVQVATDQFALAVQDGKVKADEIAATFSDVAPLAKQAGVGIDEIAATYAVLTARGVPAAEATTQMNRAMLELLKPNADLNALMAKTGQNFAEIAADKGLVVALQAVRDAAAANGVPLQDLFGRIEGLKFALATTGPNFATYASELEKMHNANGTAAAQAEERMGTFSRQVAILGETLNNLLITVGTPLLPFFTALVSGITAGINALGALPGALAGLIPAAGPVRDLINAISGAVASAATVIVQQLGPALDGLRTVFGLLLQPIQQVIAEIQHLLDLAGQAITEIGKIPGAKLVGDAASAGSPGGDILGGILGGLGNILNPTGNLVGAAQGGALPHFQSGGTVPGQGPQLAVVHGGETITPAGQGSQPVEIHVHVTNEIGGQKVNEYIERVMFNGASTYSSGFSDSPVGVR